jgi:hypothetical protein
MTPYIYTLYRTISIVVRNMKYGSVPILDRSDRRSTSIKTMTVRKHLFVLYNTSYESMELEEIHL